MTKLTAAAGTGPSASGRSAAGPSPSSVSGRGQAASPRAVLVIVCAGVVLASLDLFIVNVALPQIAKDLDAPNLSELSWVLNGYAIVYASLLVFFGRLADRYRRDRGFLAGVAIFTAASAACALSTSVAMLVTFRLVQAAGAALLTPTSLGLVLASYPAERRSGAVRAWTATGGMAAALGPVVGGLLVAVNWRLVFLVNVPVGLAALVVGWRRLPQVPGHAVESPSPVGAGLAIVGVGALTFALVKASDWGWASPAILATLAGGLGLLGVFVAHCRTSRRPLVQPELFRSRQFTGSSILAIFFSVAFGAMLLSLVLWMQGAWGWSALRAGLALSPGPAMVPLMSFLVAGRLIARYGPGRVMALGSTVFAAGAAWWALAITASPDYVAGVLGGMLLTGIGVGLTLPTMMATASSSLPPPSFATGSAVINMVRQTGLALGVAVLVAVLGSAASGHGAAQVSAASALPAFERAWWLIGAFSLLGLVPALLLVHTRRRAEVASMVPVAGPLPVAAPAVAAPAVAAAAPTPCEAATSA